VHVIPDQSLTIELMNEALLLPHLALSTSSPSDGTRYRFVTAPWCSAAFRELAFLIDSNPEQYQEYIKLLVDLNRLTTPENLVGHPSASDLGTPNSDNADRAASRSPRWPRR
jgi:hypothetical protein